MWEFWLHLPTLVMATLQGIHQSRSFLFLSPKQDCVSFSTWKMSWNETRHLQTWSIKPSREILSLPWGNIGSHVIKTAESLSAESWITLWRRGPSHSAVLPLIGFIWMRSNFIYSVIAPFYSIQLFQQWNIVYYIFEDTEGFLALFLIFFFSSCIVCFLWVLFAINLLLQLSFMLFFPKYVSVQTDRFWEWGTKKWIKTYVKYKNQIRRFSAW